MPVNEPLILINEFKFRMYIHPINKVILYFHGEAVAPWLTPYGGAADMRGWMKQNKCGIGASGSVAFDNAKYGTRHSFTVPFTRQDLPGLSAFCLQTRLTDESRLCRG